MDSPTAFDNVGHKRLKLKLDHYGIRGRINYRISSFLTRGMYANRSFRKETSDEVDVLSGV